MGLKDYNTCGKMSHSSIPLSISILLEITLEIFCNLYSLSEVLAFAATRKQLYEIWLKNVHIICREVAPRSIECHRYISQFLNRKTSEPADTAEEARQLLRTSKIIQKGIQQFEEKIVGPLADKLRHRYQSFYPNDRRPRKLTLSERPRFIRSCLKLWNILRSPAGLWGVEIASLTVRDQCLVCEMCRLPLNIGQEESPQREMVLGSPRWQGLRAQLEQALLQQIDDFMMDELHIYDTAEKYPWGRCQISDGHAGFRFLWDHTQKRCLEFCHSGTSPDICKRFGHDITNIWYESSEEEI